MIVSQFQVWAKTASPPNRADGVSALARALLYSDLSDDQKRATVRALTTFLDDPSPLVRRAIADAFASAIEAPHPIVLALAEDQPAIAGIVLSRSPVLSDAELVDFIRCGGSATQAAIASRPFLSTSLVAALAEAGSPAALVTLVENLDAELPFDAIKRMVERHGTHSALREALLARGRLPAAIRVELVASAASALAAFVTQRDWMSDERAKRITREATERATVAIAAVGSLDTADLKTLAANLRSSGQITVALALRALLSENRPLFCAMLADLSGLPPARVEGLTIQSGSTGFAALYRRGGLPLPLLPVFRLALAALRDLPPGGRTPSLSPRLIARVLADCEATGDNALDSVMVLLRRFETEAARDTARETVPVIATAPVTLTPKPAPRETQALATIHFDEAVARDRIDPPRFTIDLAALEAELLAA